MNPNGSKHVIFSLLGLAVELNTKLSPRLGLVVVVVVVVVVDVVVVVVVRSCCFVAFR